MNNGTTLNDSSSNQEVWIITEHYPHRNCGLRVVLRAGGKSVCTHRDFRGIQECKFEVCPKQKAKLEVVDR
jgi:hypothetical protein